MDNGWSLTSHDYYESHQSYYSGGTHGYDPAHPDMHAFFLAHGPAFNSGITVPAFENIQLYNLMAKVLELEPAENDGNIEMVENVLK